MSADRSHLPEPARVWLETEEAAWRAENPPFNWGSMPPQDDAAPKLTGAALTTALEELWASIRANPPTFTYAVDHGFDCVGAPVAKRTPPGTRVRVRLELGGQVIQCRPGVVTHVKGHMGPGWVYVDFGPMGAWFERDRISLEQETA